MELGVSVRWAAILASAIVAWPLAVMAWSLPDCWFEPSRLWLAGRVRACLSLLLPLLCGAWAGATVPGFALPGMLILGWALIVLAIVDARTFVLPDCLTLPLIAAGVLHSAWVNAPPQAGLQGYAFEATLSLGAAAAGFAFMALVARAFKAVRGIEGLGLGDAKLLAATGAWAGLPGLPSVVLMGSIGALVVTVVARRISSTVSPTSTTPIPFGPYLAGATWVVALYGPLSFS